MRGDSVMGQLLDGGCAEGEVYICCYGCCMNLTLTSRVDCVRLSRFSEMNSSAEL